MGDSFKGERAFKGDGQRLLNGDQVASRHSATRGGSGDSGCAVAVVAAAASRGATRALCVRGGPFPPATSSRCVWGVKGLHEWG